MAATRRPLTRGLSARTTVRGAAVSLLVCLVATAAAAEKPSPANKPQPVSLPGTAGSAALVATGNGLTTAGLYIAGRRQWALWGDWPAEANARTAADGGRAPALDKDLLAQVRDLTPATAGLARRASSASAVAVLSSPRGTGPFLAVSSLLGGKGPLASDGELAAWYETLAVAAQTTDRAFAASARANDDLTFADLLQHPGKYRGKVVRFQGRLRKLRRVEPPAVARDQGVKDLYEGWLYLDLPDESPVAVVVTELPGGLKPGDKLNVPAEVNGFFFKKLILNARHLEMMPLVVGRTLRVHKAAQPARAAKAAADPDQARAPNIDQLLIDVKDGTRTPKPWPRVEEFLSYCKTILVASKTPEQAFINSAGPNRHITFAQLHTDPARYRGKVVQVVGRLKRVRQEDVPDYLQARGLTRLYEGWIFGKTYGSNPWCVLFTELPPDIKIGEDVDYNVIFDGYFFKKYRYTAAKDDRYTPLLIGRTIRLEKKPAAPTQRAVFDHGFIVTLTALIGGTIFLAVGLSWWFRRGDRRLHRRLAASRDQPAFEDGPTHTPGPGPGADETGYRLNGP